MRPVPTVTHSLIAGSLLVLGGCAAPDHVLFVTKTSLGIDFDSTPATVSIAYDRIEGYVAPRYSNGEIPPVVASIKSDGKIFSPTIRQVYATGAAAIIATGGEASGANLPLQGTRKLMFFGATTTTGLKVGFTTALPDSFVFGFKRKDFSYIPLATVTTADGDHDVYPSVLASIDTAANVSPDGLRDATKLANSQFFATGQAATQLAASRSIRDNFSQLAVEAVRKQQADGVADEKKKVEAVEPLLQDILISFSKESTTVDQKKSIVAAAQASGMDPDHAMTIDNFNKKLTLNSSAVPNAQEKLQALQDSIKRLLAP